MAHFYASIQGNRGEATRMGTKNSGISGHIRGWDIGVSVQCWYSKERKEDRVRVYITKGSNGGGHELPVGIFFINNKGEIEKV